MWIRTEILGYALIALATVDSPAFAASYDCSIAKTPQEKLICSDPELSELDGKVGRAYASALKSLSAEGQKVLTQDERDWLRYIRSTCSDAEAGQQVSCLTSAYKGRVAELNSTGAKIGPFVFGRVDVFHDGRPNGVSTQISYPQIDSPKTPTTTAWNQEIAKAAQDQSFCDAPGEATMSYRVAMASMKLISVEFSEGTYCHGTPHGYSGSWSSTLLLSPEIRPLKLEDILDFSKPWQNFLNGWATDYIRHHVENKYFDGIPMCTEWSDARCPIDENVVQQIASSFNSWSVTRTGLDFVYQPGPHALGVHVIETPWSELKPYLRQDAPVPN